MLSYLRGVLTFLTIFSALPCFVTASQLMQAKEDLINSWKHHDETELHPFTGTHTTIDSLQHALYCGNRDVTTTPKCIRYRYESTALIEAFVVDHSALKMREAADLGLVSDGVIVSGSYCLGEQCEITADLNGIRDWCLMFLNIDPDLLTAEVSFEYQVCVENDHKNDLILILSVTCVGLVIVAFLSCLACCWMMKYRKREKDTMHSKDDILQPLNAPPPPFMPPPMHQGNDVFYSMPPPPPLPLVSHAPFRHEPAFQPPLPISHVPPPPTTPSQPSTSSNEIHVQFPKSDRRSHSRSKSFKKIRFPI